MEKKIPPTTMVIFGATGDLTRRKLLPALFRLKTLGLLPGIFNVVGLSTRPYKDEDFREMAREAIRGFSRHGPVDARMLADFTSRMFFISSAFDNPEGYRNLAARLGEIDGLSGGPAARIFYLATPPSFFPVIIENLNGAGVASDTGEPPAKIIIEKPFGRDLASARALNDLVLRYFREDQVYRIDHYLGKETVQNILFFRFANGIYEPIWNRRYIDHVEITAAEKAGVEKRGKYFEESGTLRDMVQNHLLQLLSLVAMEPPINMDADSIRSKKIDLIKSIRPIEPALVERYTVRGQYGRGVVDGKPVPAYRGEEGVRPDSTTETYVALNLMVDNWRWADVPFYLRTGKRLRRDLTEIAVYFKTVPLCLFRHAMRGCPENNVLILKIQPDEGITFQFNVKRPGSANVMEKVTMDFSYQEAFRTELPEAYERLLFDCMTGDATLFPHREGIEASWAFITDILEGWSKLPPPAFPNYESGSWGPEEADRLIRSDGRIWHNPE